MGINRPSMYAAFGNKEQLFRKALDRYVEKAGGLLHEALEQPTARLVVEHLLRGIVEHSTDGGKRRGCLLVQGALACADEAEPVRRLLASRRAATESALRVRFERAVAEGDLPKRADPAALAKYVATVQQGLSVQMNGGATRDELMAVVDVALRAWPVE